MCHYRVCIGTHSAHWGPCLHCSALQCLAIRSFSTAPLVYLARIQCLYVTCNTVRSTQQRAHLCAHLRLALVLIQNRREHGEGVLAHEKLLYVVALGQVPQHATRCRYHRFVLEVLSDRSHQSDNNPPIAHLQSIGESHVALDTGAGSVYVLWQSLSGHPAGMSTLFGTGQNERHWLLKINRSKQDSGDPNKRQLYKQQSFMWCTICCAGGALSPASYERGPHLLADVVIHTQSLHGCDRGLQGSGIV